MNLVLRRTYNDHPRPEDDDKFWTVIHQGLPVGVINEERGRSDEPPFWSWIIHLHAGRYGNGIRHEVAIEGEEATRDACLPRFRKAFERCLTYIGEEGWACHVEHRRWLDAQKARWRRQRQGTEPGGYG